MKAIFLLIGGLALSIVCTDSVEIEVVSKPHTNAPGSRGDSLGVELSADGRWAAITSSANGLVANFPDQETEFELQVYSRDLQTMETTLVSRNTNGVPANGPSIATGISADGRFIVFESDASNLVAGDDNDAADIFLYDRISGQLSMVSRPSGGSADADSSGAVITPNGRFVLYESEATNLSTIDHNEAPDLFLVDRETGGTTLITANSENSDSALAAASSPLEAVLSSDGRYVAFLSLATNHIAGMPAITNAQLYLRDMTARTNAWISRQEDGTPERYVANPTISSNGAYLAFIAGVWSTTTNILTTTGQPITIPVAGKTFVYFYSIGSGTLKKLSVPAELSGRYHLASNLALSADGRFAAYSFLAYDTVISNHVRRLFIHDTQADSHRLVPLTNQTLTNDVGNVRISADGRVILFTLMDAPRKQLYAFDQVTGESRLLSHNTAGAVANGDVVDATLSLDGSIAAFVTLASNLSEIDDPLGNDVFVTPTTGTNAVLLASAPHSTRTNATAAGSSRLPGENDMLLFDMDPILNLSYDGRYVVFTSSAPDLVPNQVDGSEGLFVRDLVDRTTFSINTSSNASLRGMSPDGSAVFYYEEEVLGVGSSRRRSPYIYDVKARTRSPAGILPDGRVSSSAFVTDVSADGRFVLFLHSDSSTPGSAFYYIRNLVEKKTTLINIAYRGTSLQSLTSGGRYLLRYFDGTTTVFDWRNETTSYFSGVSTGSSMDDAAILFVSPARTSLATHLHLFRPAQNTSNLIATNIIYPVISHDGSTIVYSQLVHSEATQSDLWRSFIFDVESNLASPLTVNEQQIKLSSRPSVTPNGRFVAFTADASGDGYSELYVFDRVLTNFTLINESLDGGVSELPVGNPSISADGTVVVFDSLSPDLVVNDRNMNSDVFVARLSTADTDSDGLEDGWEIVQFGNLAAGASQDSDNDGVSNMREFQAGTNPRDAGSTFSLETVSSGEHAFEVTWPTVAGKSHELQFRPRLESGDWQNLQRSVAVSDLMRIPISIDAQMNAFYRLRVVDDSQ